MKIIAINCKHRKNCECCPWWQFIIMIITLSPKIINIPQNPMWLFIICDWGTIITFWGYIISFWGNIINFWGTILIGGIITLWGDFQLGPRLLTFGGILLTFGGVIIDLWGHVTIGGILLFLHWSIGAKVLLGVIINNWGQDYHFLGARFYWGWLLTFGARIISSMLWGLLYAINN